MQQSFQPKVVLVTGGAGFIGSHFIHTLHARPEVSIIVNLDALTYAGNPERLGELNHSDRYHFVEGNIQDESLVASLLREYNIDTVVHFAAESHVDRSIANPNIFIESNVAGTHILLAACKLYWLDEKQYNAEQCRFHHISTDEVFGTLTLHDNPFSEQSCFKPNSPYAASKAGSDHLVRAYNITYGLPTTTSHCSNNYGPLQDAEKLIPKVIQLALSHEPIPIYGSGLQIRDWIYVQDHCNLVLKIIEKGEVGQCYNLGGGNEWKNIDLVQTLLRLLNDLKPSDMPYQDLVTHTQDRPGHDFRYALQTHHELVAFDHKTPFMDNLTKTIQSYL